MSTRRFSRAVWVAGLLLGLSLLTGMLALPVPQGLRRSAARALVGRLPPALRQRIVSETGPLLSPAFADRFSRFETMARQIQVCLRRSDGRIFAREACAALPPGARQGLGPPVPLASLVQRAARAARAVLATALLMMTFWLFQVLPVAVTALLPLVLFPLMGVAGLGQPSFPAYFSIGAQYGHHLIFLFMGTFMLSAAMVRWKLDRRVALFILGLCGSRPALLVLGFVLTTAMLSMWISNTATAAMMVPIALAVVERVEHPEARRFRTGVLLSVAYAASTGGIATLVGSPPNAVYAGFAATMAGHPVSFSEWLGFGLPFVLLFLPVLWAVQVVRYIPRGLTLPEARDLGRPGPLDAGQKGVAAVFLLMVGLWLTRSPIDVLSWPGWSSLVVGPLSLARVNDSAVAMLGAVLLFAIPVKLREGTFLLDIDTGLRISWGTLLLFGGGLTLGEGIAGTGLANWLAEGLAGLAGLGTHLLLLLVAVFGALLTEVTSNTATATMLMPVMFALGRSLGGQELRFMATAAVSTSLAFMLPIATPPNAVIFGTGHVTMGEMLRAGIILDLLAVVIWWLVVLARF